MSRRGWIVAGFAALMAWSVPQPGRAMDQSRCDVPETLANFAGSLTHVSKRLSLRQPVTILAFGSSSTEGVGASAADKTYPARLQAELLERFPGLLVTVINRGLSGEGIYHMVPRLEQEVALIHPDLVIWQVGTNDAVYGASLEDYHEVIHLGISWIKAVGADVIVMDPQYAPALLARQGYENYVQNIAEVAQEENVALFRRFNIMGYWVNSRHVGFGEIVSPDGLHMNDTSYNCVAHLLAGGIIRAATGPVERAQE